MSTEESSNQSERQDSTLVATTISHSSCCRFRPSPYPLYISVGFFFLSYSISSQLVSESVIYNKVCFDHFANVSLCSNTTFSKNHPLLQVCTAS